MVKLFLFFSISLIISCKTAEEQPDIKKDTEFKQTIQGDSLNEEAFMLKVLAPAHSFVLEEQCNYMHVHLIAQPITKDLDSLRRAMKQLTSDYWKAIPFSDKCNLNKRCGVYIYYPTDNGIDPIQSDWFGMGTRITGEEPKVQFMNLK